MNYIEVRIGNHFAIYAIVLKNRCPYKDYVEGLGNKDKTQVAVLIRYVADSGTFNTEKMRFLRDGIYELKTRGGIRIFSFFSENRMLLLTHGRKKPGPKVLKGEIDKALIIKEQFMTDRKNDRNREVELGDE